MSSIFRVNNNTNTNSKVYNSFSEASPKKEKTAILQRSKFCCHNQAK